MVTQIVSHCKVFFWCIKEEDEDLEDFDRRPYDDLADLLMNPDGDLDKLNEVHSKLINSN